MSKIICDVCGTTYPETEPVCPICGCARGTSEPTAADSAPEENGTYEYVKGGRFSKANVRKRNQKAVPARGASVPPRRKDPEEDYDDEEDYEDEEDDGGEGENNTGLIILVVVLVLAILAVLAYIGISYFSGNNDKGGKTPNKPSISAPSNPTDSNLPQPSTDPAPTNSVPTDPAPTESAPTEPTTEPTEPVDLPAGFTLKLNRKDFTLSKAGESWVLYKETNGVKASDITWTSKDPKVATVENGKVTGVDYGHTEITAQIGDQKATCIVRVSFHAQQQETPTEEDYVLSHKDVTVEVGESFSLSLTKGKNGPKVEVTWTANEDGYVTIDGGQITGKAPTSNLANKYITLTATHESKTFTCIVRVKAKQEG